MERIESLKACVDEFPSVLAQHVIHGFLQREINETRKIITHYASRRDAMCTALEKHCHELLEWRRPEGGFFVWGHLEGNLKAELVLREALRKKVAFLAGSAFFPNGDGGENEPRLDFAGQPEEQIEQGIRRLGIALRRSLEEKFPHHGRPISVRRRESGPFGLISPSPRPNL